MERSIWRVLTWAFSVLAASWLAVAATDTVRRYLDRKGYPNTAPVRLTRFALLGLLISAIWILMPRPTSWGMFGITFAAGVMWGATSRLYAHLLTQRYRSGDAHRRSREHLGYLLLAVGWMVAAAGSITFKEYRLGFDALLGLYVVTGFVAILGKRDTVFPELNGFAFLAVCPIFFIPLAFLLHPRSLEDSRGMSSGLGIGGLYASYALDWVVSRRVEGGHPESKPHC